MSHRGAWIRALIVGAVLSWTGLASTDAFAQCCQGGSATGANMWTDGLSTSAMWPPPVEATSGMVIGKEPVAEAPGWWTHGELEVGGRGFLNSPQVNGSIWGDTEPHNTTTGGYAYLGQKSLAKYYEYGIEAPGAFGGGHVATGSNDGVYQVDLWANNIASNFQGFSDQSYMLTASKIGKQGEGNQFFTVIWDETPHVYSTSAQTPYLGVGTSTLTVPAGMPSTLPALLPSLYGIDLGIQRNTAAVSYRAVDAWTAWEFNADYSHMDRTGTLPGGAVEITPTSQIPVPVNDTTQNFGANGEYLGTSLWGQRFTVKVAYNGSIYTDNISSYTVQNPATPLPGNCTSHTSSCPDGQWGTWPNNNANGFSETTSADLPLNSRYIGTVSYTVMRQDQAFQPMTNNQLAGNNPYGVPWTSVLALPVPNLGGDINTLLSNNVLNTKITPELTSKFTYRYYDFDNQTPNIFFPQWVALDGTSGAGSVPISSLSVSYVRQNAGEELNWRPTNEWTVNAGFGWEGYDYRQTDVNATNEYSGKLSVDWKPTSWLTARASGYYGDRRYDVYDHDAQNAIQFPLGLPASDTAWEYSDAYRQFMFDNRQRTKADFLLDIVALPGVTISPSVKYKDDYYGLDPLTEEGVNDQRSISTGVDVGWVATPSLSFTFTYYWEYYDQSLYNYTNYQLPYPASTPPNPNPGTCHANPAPGGGPGTYGLPGAYSNCLITTSDKEYVNTITAGMNWAAIPNALNFDVRYAVSWGVDQQAMITNASTGTGSPLSACPGCGVFPNNNNLFERLDATVTYKFDPTWVHSMGFTGDVLARLRYTWERNAVTNWQNDALAPFTDIPGLTSLLWLGYDNPNYNVQMIAASLAVRW